LLGNYGFDYLTVISPS